MAYTKLQALRAAAVTPSDTANIPNISLQSGDPITSSSACVLYVGTGGNLKVRTAGGDDVTLVNLDDGVFVPLQVVRVFATDTTASNIIALW